MSHKIVLAIIMVISARAFATTDAELRRRLELYGWSADNVRIVLSEGKTSFYPEVIPRVFGRSDIELEDRIEFAKVLGPLITASPSLQTIGLRAVMGENSTTKEPQLRLGLLEPDFILAKALWESGQLKKVGKVLYGAPPGVTVDLKSADQVDISKLPDWILANKATELFPALMTLRNRLTLKSVPTREELTRKIQAMIEKGEPAISSKLLDAVEKAMVGNRGLWGVDPRDAGAARNNKGNGKPATLKTLVVSLQDGSDLSLGRALLAAGRLEGLQRVAFPGLVDRHIEKGVMWETTNYIPENLVYDNPGLRAADLLKPESYRPAPAGLRGRGSEGLWRSPLLMSASYTTPDYSKLGCNELPKLVTTPGRGTVPVKATAPANTQ